ncbi:MAG: helix-turn-helix domain-containing protein [Pseudomonadota bacterium]
MKSENVSKSELALISAGFAVLSRNPGASLAEVAQAADVGRATLHRYFSSRADLFSALAKYAMHELEEAASAAAVDAQTHCDALRLVMGAVIPLAHRHMFLTQEGLQDPDLAEALAQQARELRELIDAAKQEGALRQELPTEWIAQAYDHLIYAAWMMIQREEATPRQAVDLAWTQFSRGAGS